MIQIKYDFPLPGEDGKYHLTEEELVRLLDAAYDNGFNAAASNKIGSTYTAIGIKGDNYEYRN